MRQYKRLSKAQISTLALGALAVSSFGLADTVLNTSNSPEIEVKTEIVRSVSESDSTGNAQEQKRNS